MNASVVDLDEPSSLSLSVQFTLATAAVGAATAAPAAGKGLVAATEAAAPPPSPVPVPVAVILVGVLFAFEVATSARLIRYVAPSAAVVAFASPPFHPLAEEQPGALVTDDGRCSSSSSNIRCFAVCQSRRRQGR